MGFRDFDKRNKRGLTVSEMRICFQSYDAVVALKDLKKSKHQRNKHPKEQIERLAKIMRAHGVRHPIHISKLSGEVCFGHGRWEAARLNGWASFPVVYQDFKDDLEEYACVQSDNAVALWAELDLPAINEDILRIGDSFDVELLGIKDFELVKPSEPGCDEDEVPEVNDTRCKPGDIWVLGNHRLMCGDSTNIQHAEALMGGEKADMVFTDPPYKFDAEGSYFDGKTKSVRQAATAGLADFDPQDLFTVLETLSVPSIYCFGSKKLILPYLQFFESSGRLWDLLAMCKANPIPSKGKNWLPDIEWLFFSRQSGAYFDDKQGFESYFRAREIKIKEREHGHPTEKQVAFIEPYMAISSPLNGKVLDLFGGSGSTLIACEKTNRKCFMMEIDPHYCDVILARWEKYTGKKAVLDGQT